MKREVLSIRGMHCVNCARRIEKGLLRLDGVSVCKADYAGENAEIVYDSGRVSREAIGERVRELGYEVQETDSQSLQTASILVILLALYLIANHLGLFALFNAFPVAESGMSYGAVFLVGLLTSVHCVAMCGGINLSQSVLSAERGGSVLRDNLLYEAGRVLSYALIGGIAGTLGGALGFQGRARGFILLFAGVLMLGMALRMLGVFTVLRRIRLPLSFARLTGKLARPEAMRSSFIIGLLNGLMPCGPLQSMQIYALSTGSFVGGALSMLLFGLGTAPLMLGFGALSGHWNRKYAGRILTISASLVFMMGLGMIGRGVSLSGVSWPAPAGESVKTAAIADGRQFVRSETDYGSYQSIEVRRGIPVEWTIHVPEGKLNGCNGEILVQEYALDIPLHEGDNLVKFTPEKSGTVSFSCWMGMIRGSIRVTDGS